MPFVRGLRSLMSDPAFALLVAVSIGGALSFFALWWLHPAD